MVKCTEAANCKDEGKKKLKKWKRYAMIQEDEDKKEEKKEGERGRKEESLTGSGGGQRPWYEAVQDIGQEQRPEKQQGRLVEEQLRWWQGWRRRRALGHSACPDG